jgi:hypothetical protein
MLPGFDDERRKSRAGLNVTALMLGRAGRDLESFVEADCPGGRWLSRRGLLAHESWRCSSKDGAYNNLNT